MKKHTSGLATPLSPSNGSSSQQEKQLLQAMQQQAPSWTTHPQDTKRISQASHTTSHTSHQNPERLADYSFDRVYSPQEATAKLYEESIRGVVGSVVEGFHGSVFAYGQTASGKTHTMAGSHSQPGVVRLAVQDIFDRIRSQSSNTSTSREYLVRVSYLEIYNEQIYDLLALQASPSKFKSSLQHHHLPPSTSVRIFESRTEGVIVRGLREEIVTCPEDVFALLDDGDAKRKTGSTGMNKTSSRSHSVFRLVLESRASRSSSGGGGVPPLVPSSNSSVNSDTDSVATGRSSITQQSLGASKGPVRISSLSLVDLAGSESVKATGSTGVRQKEGQYINKSLLTLGHVVHKLSEMSSKEKPGLMAPKEHIPYRDSKLTRLLQPSLGGNAQVCIICNISPALANLEESHNTLKFAMRAKKIQQNAKITEVADEKTLLSSYRQEIEELKRQLQEAKRVAVEVRQAALVQPQMHPQGQRTPRYPAGSGSSSDDEEDQDDTHVLVSAITNLESLILKAGANKSTRKLTTDGEGDELRLPSRALDAALMKAEESEIVMNDANQLSEMSSPAMSANLDKSSLASPTTAHHDGNEENDHLLEELHRIQGMLGTVMKKKRKGGAVKATTGGGSAGVGNTPERDAEVERLRLQLQEQDVTSMMRKADSSFLQSQLNVKEGILKEVSVLLGALEKRQLELESENKQLKEDLAEATNMIEEGNLAKKLLEKKLDEKKDHEKKDIVFVERPTATTPPPEPIIDDPTTYSLHTPPYPPPPPPHGFLPITLETPPLPHRDSF